MILNQPFLFWLQIVEKQENKQTINKFLINLKAIEKYAAFYKKNLFKINYAFFQLLVCEIRCIWHGTLLCQVIQLIS